MLSNFRKFGLSMLVAVMGIAFSVPGLASLSGSLHQFSESSNSFYEAFDLHVNDVEDSLFTSNHFDDTESFLLTSIDFDSYAEIEGVQLLPRITSVLTFEKETSVKAYNVVTAFELLNNEVGWTAHTF
jgi:hypothetical protein